MMLQQEGHYKELCDVEKEALLSLREQQFSRFKELMNKLNLDDGYNPVCVFSCCLFSFHVYIYTCIHLFIREATHSPE